MSYNMYKYYVYKLVFPNSKIYIGITKNIKRRFSDHKRCNTNVLVHKAIRKYGWDNVHKDVIDTTIATTMAYELEKKYIDIFKSNDIEYGYNSTSGGEEFKEYTVIVRKKMSKAKEGMFLGEDNPNYGKGCKGEDNGSAKLTWEKVDKIRALAKTGIQDSDLAKKYGVWSTTIRNIVNNTSWIKESNFPLYRNRNSLVIACDIDGTIWSNSYPEIGEPIANCKEVMLRLSQRGHIFVLWTARQNRPLYKAVKWLKKEGYPVQYANINIPGAPYCTRKIYADLYIDDRSIGGLIDWLEIEQIIINIENGGENKRINNER